MSHVKETAGVSLKMKKNKKRPDNYMISSNSRVDLFYLETSMIF